MASPVVSCSGGGVVCLEDSRRRGLLSLTKELPPGFIQDMESGGEGGGDDRGLSLVLDILLTD